MERIQKVIAASGVTSRRKAEELIAQGRVKVNGVIVENLGFKVMPKDQILVDDVEITKSLKYYFVLNKPRGVVSTVSDQFNRKTVIDFLPPELKDMRLFPVGRLDYDTKGVIILTNDGEFTNRLVGPTSGIQKEYLVRVKGIISSEEVIQLQKGVMINNKKTLPAIVVIDSVDRKNNSSLVRITITEGMYHQVKEMFKSVNHEVKHLTRVRFGCIRIDNLHEGEIRKLSIHEIKTLYELSKADKVIKKVSFNKLNLF